MPTTTKLLGALVTAVFLGACAHGVKKSAISATANPSEELTRLDSDIATGFEAQYDVLDSPDFKKAQSYRQEAKEDLRNGKKQETVLDDIAYSRAYLQRTKEISEGRMESVQGILDARQAALNAGVRNFPTQSDRLKNVDDDLRDVVGDKYVPASKYNELQSAYFDLELSGIQASQLDSANSRIAGAKHNKASSLAPTMLHQAEVDFSDAQNDVAANRHNPAGYKDSVARANRSSQLLVEVLAATNANGRRVPEATAIEVVRQRHQISHLSNQLGKSQSESEALGQTVNSQEKVLSEAQAIRSMDEAMNKARQEFSKDEAEVYREGDKLLIRLKAMNFASGRADLPSDSLPLLAKVKGIAEEMNPSQVVVEGHTDSTGSASTNLQLSQDRAQSVAKYLGSNGIDSEKIQAVGQGFQAPIASNKSKSGRAQNRRVDVIITPTAK